MQSGQNSAGAETSKEGKNQLFLYVGRWKELQRQCETIAQWLKDIVTSYREIDVFCISYFTRKACP